MAALVTLAEAKQHLRRPPDVESEDEDITRKAAQASDIIRDYLADRADETWTEVTVPTLVKAAVLLMLTHLYAHRGDDPASDEALWDAIRRLLARWRDLAFA
jgi:hypothetical protein